MIGVEADLPKVVKTPKRQKVHSKNDTSSAYIEKMLNELTMKNIVCKSSPGMKKHKTKTYNENKSLYFCLAM